MKNLAGKVAVVTGAASGIGRELAKNLAAKGCRLALSDIRQQDLDETTAALGLASDDVMTAVVDVSDREGMANFAQQVVDHFGQVDIVINNAGISSTGDFEQQSYETCEKVIGVNMWGVFHGSRLFLPHLRARPEAALVNVSSINGFFPFPGGSPYNMSKYAVLGLNETLMMELKHSKVQVLSVHPGFINTNIANFGIGQTEEQKQAFTKAAMTTPEQCAAQIVKGIQKKKSHIYVGPDAKLFHLLKRLNAKLALKLSYYIIRVHGTKGSRQVSRAQ